MMPQYSITLSREAGVYTTTVTVSAGSEEAAKNDALRQAEKMKLEEWKYSEDYFLYEKPLIQVEDTREIMA